MLSMVPVLCGGQVSLIAHRGESFLAPENTMAAFRLAWELGAEAVELDIHLSLDNRIMVIHDGNTKRTSGQDFEVKNTTSDMLRQLDVGSFKDSSFAGEKIPFLEEALLTIPPDGKLVIEVKSGMDVLPWLEKLIGTSIQAPQCMFIAFDWQVILALRDMFPGNACYWLSSNRNEVLAKMGEAAEKGLDGINLHYSIIDEKMMELARSHGLDVLAWTVDDPAEARRLFNLGVQSVTSNRTSWLRRQLQ